jgi:hypothetical protein
MGEPNSIEPVVGLGLVPAANSFAVKLKCITDPTGPHRLFQ